MDNETRRSQALERTRCAIAFEGFPNHVPVPSLGRSFETWKELAVTVEAQFPDPFRLLRALANTKSPPEIVFLWLLNIQANGIMVAHVERCVSVQTPVCWHYWGSDSVHHHLDLSGLVRPKSPVTINEERVQYHYPTPHGPESLEEIARDIAQQLRLPSDPPEYKPEE